MKFCDSFSFQPLPSSPNREPHSTLVRDGIGTSTILPGVILEAQLHLADGRNLLLLTCDCPYEEQVHVILLDSRHQFLDHLTLGASYTPGLVSVISITSNSSLDFSFSGTTYCLTIRSEPTKRSLTSLLRRVIHGPARLLELTPSPS